ncbi:MAG: L,D-transpeptidase [Alphaproteobacteria bacterium]|nr:L,D-transpeptidase [Alphaproteobacteria bacterium]MBL7097377.1 L,D-transpeptidase [Alphaproteobacteria bacterium]
MAKAISVDMPSFTITASEDGKVVKTIDRCAFGRVGHLTPIIENGDISPTKRDRNHVSSLYKDSKGHPAVMRFALFFEQDPTCAFHEGDPNTPSHGCVHLLSADAEWLFDWAGHDPVALHMKGPYPASPVKAGAASA